MKNLLFIILLSFILGCTSEYRIEQKIVSEPMFKKINYTRYDTIRYSGGYYVNSVGTGYRQQCKERMLLITSAWYGDINVFNRKDSLNLSNDTIKCFRYNEAMAVINDYKRFDNIKCN